MAKMITTRKGEGEQMNKTIIIVIVLTILGIILVMYGMKVISSLK